MREWYANLQQQWSGSLSIFVRLFSVAATDAPGLAQRWVLWATEPMRPGRLLALQPDQAAPARAHLLNSPEIGSLAARSEGLEPDLSKASGNDEVRATAPGSGGRVHFHTTRPASERLHYGLPVRDSRARSLRDEVTARTPTSDFDEDEFDPEYLAIVEAIVRDGRIDDDFVPVSPSVGDRVRLMRDQLKARRVRFRWIPIGQRRR
jgi:hypothetical protein